jgi:XTP/dITP diphosphohydrolase
MPTLLIATTNQAKIAEYRLLLTPYPLKLVSPRDVGIERQPEENGDTFVENARAKAHFYFQLSALPTLADDGGLEVDALDGAPGVRSHRWLGYDHPDDKMLAEEVIRRMANVDPRRRRARLRAAAVLLYQPNGATDEAVAEASLEGIIADACYPEVRPGFPYRSVLYLPDRGKYLAELSEAEAARLSQRRILLEQLAPHLTTLAGGRNAAPSSKTVPL